MTILRESHELVLREIMLGEGSTLGFEVSVTVETGLPPLVGVRLLQGKEVIPLMRRPDGGDLNGVGLPPDQAEHLAEALREAAALARERSK